VDTLLFHEANNSAAVTTPPYANPHAFKAENVTVGAAPNLCDGILTIPTAAAAPFPAAVLFSGSGANDKNESIGPNHPFADLAEGLSTRGIAVLRYDKRTYSHENIDPAHFTVEQEYLQDAVAAVALLRARPEVDRKRIFVIGHSEGALLAPEIANRTAPVAGVVMLAPMGAAPLLDTMIRQLRYLGAPPARISEIEKVRQEVNSGKLPASRTVWLLGDQVPVGYLMDLNRRDEIGIARHLGVPILIMHGGRDYQVIDQDIAAWRSGLKGTPDVSFREFPSLNHLFIAGSGQPGPLEYANAGHVDEPVVMAVADFILQRPSMVSISETGLLVESEDLNSVAEGTSVIN
jgi:dienelactone hydrolase